MLFLASKPGNPELLLFFLTGTETLSQDLELLSLPSTKSVPSLLFS